MRRRTWKDDIPTLAVATAAQFGLVRAVDWARASTESSELAAHLVNRRFYFGPQILSLLLVFLVVRLIHHALDLRGLRLSEWLRSSALVLLLGLSCIAISHLDQALVILAALVPLGGLPPAAQTLAGSPFYSLLERTATLRFAIDLVGFALAILALRLGQPQNPDRMAARTSMEEGDYLHAADLYLKAGDPKAAKEMLRKGKAPARLAALEQRDGDPAEAARLYEDAGDAYALEASRAWEAAGNPAAAEKARLRALAVARAGLRWDRVAEIAETVGDHASLAEACRRLAETTLPGPVRGALWRRAGDAFRTAGKPVEAAEAYKNAQEFGLAGELFLEGGKPVEAAREFERSGALSRAAMAAAIAGDEKSSHELAARDAEARGDLAMAGEAWRKAGQTLRAAGLLERAGAFAAAAAAWKEAGRTEKAAPLFEKAGQTVLAAEAYEQSAQPEKAAALYLDMKEFDKAAALFRSAGRVPQAAAALKSAGRLSEAASLYHRAGLGLDAARCLLLAGRRDSAWEHLIAVPRTEAGVAEVFHELARAHLQASEPRDAIHVLREYLGPGAVDEHNLPLHRTLLAAMRAAGDSTEGVELGKIAQFDPSVVQGSTVAPIMPGVVADHATRDLSNAAMILTPPVHRGEARAAAPASLLPPAAQRLGLPAGTLGMAAETPETRYEILAELGRGGMGVVHKALDRKLDRFVALKILPWQLRSDETAMRYFKREARAIAAMTHPNIVALYDYGEGFGSLYLAMEYLERPNLQSLLKRDRERVKQHWRDWFIQSARGIAAAHSKGILHRDLKPANLILDEHGMVRILDFGLALPEADAGGTSKLIGSPAFFPPEVLKGEMPSASSDVYSLGAAFYTLATGRWPYIGDDVLVARLERDPDDPRPYARFLSELEVMILMKSLARHRPDRYADGGELLAALLAVDA